MRTLVALIPLVFAHFAVAAERPNIVLIMSDDMGYTDVGCYGGEIATPNLDQLAASGVRFSQFYNTGRCCPTRASLLTGLYSHQAGVGHMMGRWTDELPGYRGDLSRDCVTIAEVLKPAGYATYMVGKWHVAQDTAPEGPKHNWPLQRGFERFYGTITGAGSFFDPGTLTRDNTMISPLADPQYDVQPYYYTDAISDHAVRYINDHVGQDDERPFFMYVAYTAAHWPMHALEKDIAKYRGKYDQGYAAVREARLERAREMGLIDPRWQLSPQHGDWQNVEHREWELRGMEVYAAMIDNMDQGIGRITAALREHQKLDNTLILFMQDNGGCQEGNGRRGDWQRPVPASLPEIAADAIRTDVVPKQNRAGVPTLTGPGIMPGPEDTYIAYGIDWANVSNTPFREYKHFVHEGGIATPLIAHWPKGFERQGKIEHQPAHLIDLMATCVELADADYPREFAGQSIHPLEGVSLVPALRGESLARPQPLFWEHEGNRAIRDGRWKLVAKENQPWELYDLEADRTEMHDLAQEKPELVNELAAKWDAWAERADVLPLGSWRRPREENKLNRQQREFKLQVGDSLSREQAPFVENRPLTIDVQIRQTAEHGVLVAQGGSSEGYALFVSEGRLVFATRHGGELTTVEADVDWGPSAEVQVRLQRSGRVILRVDGQKVAEGTVPGLLPRMPIDGLQVGRDAGGTVGPYTGPFPFTGQLATVTITL